ncbi:MAG: 2,3-epoxybenzoyl-CoA dihydrolase, partial [Jannaschia sp.]
MSRIIDFRTDPSAYRHWRVAYDGPVAHLTMDVDEDGGLFEGYQLKLNSYDLGVDIELADIVQRMRFEHPEVRAVVMRSGKDKVFCAGANIRMLGGAKHSHKVNFCKFTNETRNTYEAAEADSGQTYIAAVRGACAGGGYELALACNHIMMVDDGATTVSLPEVPLLAVLPGTGGLTRVTDKRRVRRDRADVFCSTEEGVKGRRALDWRLVDEIVPNARFDEIVADRAREIAARNPRDGANGIALTPVERTFTDAALTWSTVDVAIDRAARTATITVHGPEDAPRPIDKVDASDWILRAARDLDDAILHLRLNEPDLGTLVWQSQGNPARVAAHEATLDADHWLANEIRQYWKRVLKRIDVTSRSMIALVEHGSCFAGVLAEILFAADRSYMMEDAFEGDNRPLAAIHLTPANFGPMPMANGLTRLETRFLGEPDAVEVARAHPGAIEAEDAAALGLVTEILDDIDWEDEIRIILEERAS